MMVESSTEMRVLRLLDWLALAFWPLWSVVAVLQLLDVCSVVLGTVAHLPIREANPVILHLAAHTSLGVALLVKFAVIAAWLALVWGLWALCDRHGWRAGKLACTVLTSAAAAFSAWVFWWTVATLITAR